LKTMLLGKYTTQRIANIGECSMRRRAKFTTERHGETRRSTDRRFADIGLSQKKIDSEKVRRWEDKKIRRLESEKGERRKREDGRKEDKQDQNGERSKSLSQGLR